MSLLPRSSTWHVPIVGWQPVQQASASPVSAVTVTQTPRRGGGLELGADNTQSGSSADTTRQQPFYFSISRHQCFLPSPSTRHPLQQQQHPLFSGTPPLLSAYSPHKAREGTHCSTLFFFFYPATPNPELSFFVHVALGLCPIVLPFFPP